MPTLNPGRSIYLVSLETSFLMSSSAANPFKKSGIVIFNKNPSTGQITSFRHNSISSLTEIKKYFGYQIDNNSTEVINFSNKFLGFGNSVDTSLVKGDPRFPVAKLNANVVTGVAPLTVNYTAVGSSAGSGSSILGYEYKPGDGSVTGYSNTFSHTFNTPGVYPSTLRVMNAEGIYSDIDSVTITVTSQGNNSNSETMIGMNL